MDYCGNAEAVYLGFPCELIGFNSTKVPKYMMTRF